MNSKKQDLDDFKHFLINYSVCNYDIGKALSTHDPYLYRQAKTLKTELENKLVCMYTKLVQKLDSIKVVINDEKQ